MRSNRDIGFVVKTLSNMIKRKMDEYSREYGLEEVTGMQGWILSYLYHHRDEEICQRDLEREFTIRRSTVTNLLQLMEKNGLIVREPVGHDARLKRLLLTEKAVKSHRAVTERIEYMEACLREGMSGEEIDEFFRLMQKLQQNAEKIGGD